MKDHPHKGTRLLFPNAPTNDHLDYLDKKRMVVSRVWITMFGKHLVIMAEDMLNGIWVRNCNYRTKESLVAAAKGYSRSRHIKPMNKLWIPLYKL